MTSTSFNVFDWFYSTAGLFPTDWDLSSSLRKKLVISSVNNSIKYENDSNITIQTSTPFKRTKINSKEYYYEVSLIKGTSVTIGFAPANFSQSKLTGSEKGSYGLSSGSFRADGSSAVSVETKFAENDIIGIGIHENGSLYYTQNGKEFTTTVTLEEAVLYPTISFSGKVEFAVNLGSIMFSYSHPAFTKFLNAIKLEDSFAYSERYITHITTDKPIYRPGDTLYFRGWILHALTNAPIANDLASRIFPQGLVAGRVMVVSPSGAEAFKDELSAPVDSTVAGSWVIPEDLAGGDYVLKVVYDIEGFPASQRKINIREMTSNPRLKLQLDFEKKGYGANDQAVALLTVERAEGGVPEGATITATARIDGAEIYRGTGTLPKDGKYTVKYRIDIERSNNDRFTLPSSMTTGQGTLTCTVDDHGTVESTGQSIPILLQSLKMQVYPEGGYLVAGIKNRVYVEAFLPNGDPADFAGEIVDAKGIKVGNISTTHEGRGSGTFFPQDGREYSIRVVYPASVTSVTNLPPIQPVGAVLSAMRNVYSTESPVDFQVASTTAGSYIIRLFKREKEIAVIPVKVSTPRVLVEASTILPNSLESYGILRATLYESISNLPIAERLIFRKPSKNLNVDIRIDSIRYSPGQPVKLAVKTCDEKGVPLSALVGVCVTDDTVLEMVQKRKQVPRLPVMAYFENEVDRLEDAHVYMDPSHPKAEIAVDLLLGTQGWRRFAYTDIPSFLQHSKDKEGAKNPNNNNNNAKKAVSRAADIDAAERLLGIHQGGLLEKSANAPLPRRRNSDSSDVYSEEEDDDEEEEEEEEERPARRYKEAPRRDQVKEKKMEAPVVARRNVAQATKVALVKSKPSVAIARDVLEEEKPEEKKRSVQAFAEFTLSRSEAQYEQEEEAVYIDKEECADDIYIEPIQTVTPRKVAVRVYAHKADRTKDPDDRSDFSETLYWNASFKTSVEPTQSFSFDSLKSSRNCEVTGNSIKNLSSSWSTAFGCNSIDVSPSAKFSYRVLLDNYQHSDYMVGLSQITNRTEHYLGSHGWAFYGSGYIYERGSSRYISDSHNINTGVIEVKIDGLTISYLHNGRLIGSSTMQAGVYWFGVSVCNANGSIEVQGNSGNNLIEFDLNDSITSFKVWVEAVSANSTNCVMFASSSIVLSSTNPFYIDYKLPIETTSGDNMLIPVSVVNNTTSSFDVTFAQSGSDEGKVLVFPQAEAKDTLGYSPLKIGNFNMQQGSRRRANIEALVKPAYRNIALTLNAKSKEYSDTVTRNTRVVPKGFPYCLAYAGRLESNSSDTFEFKLPKDVDPDSIVTAIRFYLSPLSSMTEALQYLIRSPGGCFEQTSSTLYPMVMAQQYFMSHRGVNKQIMENAKTHIESGYNRLCGFEVKDNKGQKIGGFDWYGSPPPNESLTAYGLLEFADMAQVFPVEPALIPRVRGWLLSRRDGSGGFLRGQGRYGFGNAPQDITNAYICWALAETGQPYADIKKEVDSLMEVGEKAKRDDPYFLSLLASTLFTLGLKEQGEKYAYYLTELQASNGCVGGKKKDERSVNFTTITYSWGDGLLISCTSLAIYAWMKGGSDFTKFCESGMKWLASKCKDGGFGDTQSTILALRTIVAYEKLKAFDKPGTVILSLDGKEVERKTIDPTTQHLEPTVQFASLKGLTKKHKVTLKMEGGCTVPFSMAIRYNAAKPDNDPNCPVELSTKLSSTKINEGEGTEIFVCMKNLDKKSGQPMTIAVIGLPGGLEPRHQQLQELVKAGTIDFYEVLGREIAIYLREMGPAQEVTFKIDVEAKIPGKYTGQASRIYLYYTEESKFWNDPLSVSIQPSDS